MPPSTPSPLNALLQYRPAEPRTEELLATVARVLGQSGIPVYRCGATLVTSHPEIFIEVVIWESGTSRVSQVTHEESTQELDELSPIFEVRRTHQPRRFRLEVPAESLPWSDLRALAAAGATDYVCLPIDVGCGVWTYFSFATREPGGFRDEAVDTLLNLRPVLELHLSLCGHARAKRQLLSVYLGENAAHRVLAGAFKRGTGEPIDAAIWFCDLRGFTSFSDQRPVTEVVRTLDQYFERVAEPVMANGGEVLKFIGDAMLAIFRVSQGGPADACTRALAAAEQALDGVARLDTGQGERLRIGVALHLGQVMYGNLGARERLDFTVIGAAVNEVCRIEALCKELGNPLLMTAAFRQHIGKPTVSAGSFALKGVGGEREVFTLAPPA